MTFAFKTNSFKSEAGKCKIKTLKLFDIYFQEIHVCLQTTVSDEVAA